MKKFKLILTRSLTLTLLAVLTSTVLKAQSPHLPTTGTSNEYSISSVTDWNTFVEDVNHNYCNYDGKTVKLLADIGTVENPVTTMVGYYSEETKRPFRGIFLGENHTLTVSYTAVGVNQETGKVEYTAPFVCTEGAEINKLHVAGTIDAKKGYAAGVIGINYGAKTRINGRYNIISVNIIGGGEYCAGLVVEESAVVEMSSCVYNGQIKAGDHSAGFCAIGFSGSANTKIIECQFTPASESSITGENINTFVNGTLNSYSKNFYYTYKVGSSTQGKCAYSSYADAPAESPFTYCKQLYDNNYYYVEGEATINGLNASYYQNYVTQVGLNYSVTFTEPDVEAVTLASESYTATIKDSDNNTVSIASITPGNYTLVIEGIEGYCKGKITAGFEVKADIFEHGYGTETDPYEIRDIDDWVDFGHAVNNGHSFLGEYLILKEDIVVTVTKDETVHTTDKIIGIMTESGSNYVEDKWFSGTFDGGWKKITFNVGTKGNEVDPGNNVSPNAPFRVIDGATIKNLTVDGAIYSKKKYNSGLIGFAFSAKTGNQNYILNCTSSIFIDCTEFGNTGNKYDCSSAGFLAENKDNKGGISVSIITFENCVFNGEINEGTKDPVIHKTRAAGFVSYNNGTLSFINCTMDGKITLTGDANHIKNFYRNLTATLKEAYYTKNNYGGGTQAPTSEPADKFAKKYTYDATTYYVPGAVITDIETVYSYTGTAVVITPITVCYYGRKLTRGTDYIIKIDGTEVPTETTPTINGTPEEIEGAHTVIVEGIGSYAGKKTMGIMVENFDTWAKVKEILAYETDGVKEITLSANIIPDVPTGNEALVVNGTVVLNLNYKTVNRGLVDLDSRVNYGQVFRVNEGASLTINGPGTVTGGYSIAVDQINDNNENAGSYKNDAGGIYNKGTLVLNNVTVTNNKCVKNPDEPTNSSVTARGGGICNDKGSSFTMIGGSVTNNVAKGGGGGVFSFKPAYFSMTDVDIINNESESKGGGVRIIGNTGSSAAEATLINCNIKKNRATETNLTRHSDGGGVYLDDGKLRMENCTIGGAVEDANQSAFAGAGFYQDKGTTYAKNCTISYNSAYTEHDKMFGGGICLHAGSFTLDGGVITNNHSYMDGGGVYIVSGATFNVLGKILIDDNFRTRKGAEPQDTDNNTYTAGNAVINVIGELDPDTRIHITGHGFGGVYTSGLEEYANEANFVTDGKYQLLNLYSDTIQEITLVPYIWYKEGTWGEDGAPTPSTDVKIDRAIELEPGEIGYANSIEFVNGKIVLKDGAQMICNTNLTGTPIEIHIQKTITAAPNPEEDTPCGWHIVSVPMDEVKVYDEFENGTNFVSKSSPYDLMLYDEPTHWWWKYDDKNRYFKVNGKTHNNTHKGRGYLYRNAQNRSLEFTGKMNIDDVTYNLTRKGEKLKGFHLIGNPYVHGVYKGNGAAIPNTSEEGNQLLADGFYTLSDAGAWIAKTDNTDSIGVCEGILVKAINYGTLTMKNTISKGGSSKGKVNSISFSVSNNTYKDVAYAIFDNGYGLDKIAHINEDIPMVYIRQDDADYAIATMGEETRMFNLCFKAKTTGIYTLKVKPEGDFRYLHLIDNLTGEDIDLLKEQEYSFVSSIVDNDERFMVLVDENAVSDNDVFAFQNGDNIIVSGEGELKIFDVLARMVSRQRINGVTAIRKPDKAGVYVLRLEGSSVKSQKIVVK